MRAKRLSHIVFAVFAILLLGGMAAFAAAPPAPIQTPLSPTKIPQFAQPLDTLDVRALVPGYNRGNPAIPVALGTVPLDLSICEYQVDVLPPGTPVVAPLIPPQGFVLGKTYVFGYQLGTACNNAYIPNRSYLGPAVVAFKGTPTQMTYWNRLPDASMANVAAYRTSVDQTVIWGDPLSLDLVRNQTRISATAPLNPTGAVPPPAGTILPEANECWILQQQLVPLALMPAACLNNYGFLAPQPTTAIYTAPVPAAVHLHGGEVPSVLDGGPDAWWTSNGIYGHGFYSKGGVIDAASGKAVYVYPNGQEPAPTWFHDHMLGATRLNVYAGIAGAYVQIDPAFPLAPGLDPLGLLYPPATAPTLEPTIPVIIQDRMFDTNGQLYFPNIGINPEHPFWVPEFVGDTIAVNGKVWPFLNVEPRAYRFLFLNGSNARSYELLFNGGPSIYVIGNDQGYLDAAQMINPAAKVNNKLYMMPGERYEVVIDFSLFAGKSLILQNTAQVPWGGPGFGGAPVNGTTTGRIMQFRVAAVPKGGVLPPQSLWSPAQGARVRAAGSNMVRLTNPVTGTPAAGVIIHKTRRLTLNEVLTKAGPLEILVNNTLYDGSKPIKNPPLPNRPNDFTPIAGLTGWNTSMYSELPHEGETEQWDIVNTTADAHPMHPHLVAFQVLKRTPLNVKTYLAAYNLAFPGGLPLDGWGPPLDYNCGGGTPGRGVIPATGPGSCVFGGNPDPAAIVGAVAGPALPPRPQEIGWKDTVQADANMITSVLVRFAKATDDICTRQTPGVVTTPCVADNANTIGYDFDPNHGHGFVWHCHIVDHEDNEMMRPFTVVSNPGVIHTYIQGPGPGQY